MYSLICRNAKVSLIPNQVQAPPEKRMSSFRLKLPTDELERSIKVKEKLESSLMMKKLLLGLVLFGTAMFISNGVITPAMSGLFLLLDTRSVVHHKELKNKTCLFSLQL